MLGLKQMLTFIISSITIFWARINQKIFCAGEILKTRNIRLEEVLLMMARCFIFFIALELYDIICIIFICP